MRDRNASLPVAGLIALGLAAKFFVDTSSQIFLPFLPITAAGLGISVLAMGRLVSVMSFAGLIAPLTGALADKIGHKPLIRSGLLLCGAGMLLIASDLGLVGALAGMVLNGFGVAAFTPNLHAYLSERLPYDKRARGLGILEYSWALAGILGLFLAGHLIERLSWNAPLFILGGALVAFAFVYGALPSSRKLAHRSREAGPRPRKIGVGRADGSLQVFLSGSIRRIRKFFDLGEHAVSAWAGICAAGLHMFGISNIMIIHGEWLKAQYGLGAAKLGNVALLFGLVDWAASIVVSVFVDRIGKKRAFLIGIGGALLGYALLPVLNKSLALIVLGFCIPRMFFEFGIVSNFPLLSEQNPRMRGKILSLNMALCFIGRALSGITGPWLYLHFGQWVLAAASFAAALMSFLSGLFLVSENPGRVLHP